MGNQGNQVGIILRVEIQVIQAEMKLVLPLFEEVNGLVDGNPVKPGIKTGAALEGFKRRKRLDKGFLGEIVGVLVIGRHVVNCGVNSLLITLYQIIVRREIAIPRALHQFPFRGFGGNIGFGRGSWFGHIAFG